MSASFVPATPRQLDFLRSLARRKAVYGTDWSPNATVLLMENELEGLSKDDASELINRALAAPNHRKPGDPVLLSDVPGIDPVSVPEGYFALETPSGTRFYRVGESKRGSTIGHMVIMRIAGDSEMLLYPNEARDAIDGILADPMDAAWRFADLIGKCHRCGKTLTDDVSRLLSIGPNCRGFAPTKAVRALAINPALKTKFRHLQPSLLPDRSPISQEKVQAAAGWMSLPGMDAVPDDDLLVLIERAQAGDIDPVVQDALLTAPRDTLRLLLNASALSDSLLLVLIEHTDARVRQDATAAMATAAMA